MLRGVGQRLDDGRWFAPAAERNKGPILAVLERVLPATGLVLEIASGTGQHVAHFARALPGLTWQPSDPEAVLREAIARRVAQENLGNVRAPVELDVCRHPWPLASADAVVCINMVHIAPWSATQALLSGTATLLGQNGVLFLYGPYRRFGAHTAPSNEAFDAQLRSTDPAWGVRDLEAVEELAAQWKLMAEEIVEMPANNFSIVLRKRGA